MNTAWLRYECAMSAVERRMGGDEPQIDARIVLR